METKLEQIAVKARCEPNLRFNSLAHHITCERVLKNLLQIPKRSAAGVDDQTVEGLRPPPAAIAPSDELEINLLFDGFD